MKHASVSSSHRFFFALWSLFGSCPVLISCRHFPTPPCCLPIRTLPVQCGAEYLGSRRSRAASTSRDKMLVAVGQ